MPSKQNVAIIGAGPYGLSIAAHLAKANIDFRIFGTPMQTWRQRMPKGMHLKSEPFASNLYDPDGSFRLSDYFAEQGIAYRAIGMPVPLAAFADYGVSFQERYVPMLEEKNVVLVRRSACGFEVVDDGGTRSEFRRVVVATGLSHYAHLPKPLDGCPSDLVSHSSAYHDFSAFSGCTVAVVGGGSSAVDCAVGLAEAGATVRLITRRPEVAFHSPPRARSMVERLLWPMTPLGSGWKSFAFVHAPHLFKCLPQAARYDIVRTHLGPVAGWFTREKFEQNVQVLRGSVVSDIRRAGGQIALSCNTDDGLERTDVDHVLAATGYRIDVGRLRFLDRTIIDSICRVAPIPRLSSAFESSVPGLHFVGPSAAYSFGPVLRFACGANFTAKRLSQFFARRDRTIATPLVALPRRVRRCA